MFQFPSLNTDIESPDDEIKKYLRSLITQNPQLSFEEAIGGLKQQYPDIPEFDISRLAVEAGLKQTIVAQPKPTPVAPVQEKVQPYSDEFMPLPPTEAQIAALKAPTMSPGVVPSSDTTAVTSAQKVEETTSEILQYTAVSPYQLTEEQHNILQQRVPITQDNAIAAVWAGVPTEVVQKALEMGGVNVALAGWTPTEDGLREFHTQVSEMIQRNPRLAQMGFTPETWGQIFQKNYEGKKAGIADTLELPQTIAELEKAAKEFIAPLPFGPPAAEREALPTGFQIDSAGDMVTPEGWKLTGENTIVTPEGKTYLEQDIQNEDDLRTELETAISKIFPNEDVASLNKWADENPEEFYKEIQAAGDTIWSRAILTRMGLTSEEIKAIYPKLITVPGFEGIGMRAAGDMAGSIDPRTGYPVDTPPTKWQEFMDVLEKWGKEQLENEPQVKIVNEWVSNPSVPNRFRNIFMSLFDQTMPVMDTLRAIGLIFEAVDVGVSSAYRKEPYAIWEGTTLIPSGEGTGGIPWTLTTKHLTEIPLSLVGPGEVMAGGRTLKGVQAVIAKLAGRVLRGEARNVIERVAAKEAENLAGVAVKDLVDDASKLAKETLANDVVPPEVKVPKLRKVKPGEPSTADMIRNADGTFTKTEQVPYKKFEPSVDPVPEPDKSIVDKVTGQTYVEKQQALATSDVARYQRTLNDIEKELSVPKLPKGRRASLIKEKATTQARLDISQIWAGEGNDAEKLAKVQDELSLIEESLGRRSIPYGKDLKSDPFRGVPDVELNPRWRVFDDFVSTQKAAMELEPPLTPPVEAQTGLKAGEVVKEPWQMTLDEYITPWKNKKGEINPQVKGGLRGNHRNDIAAAIKEGKPIPPEVLVEYPDLVKPTVTAAEAIPPVKPPEPPIKAGVSPETTGGEIQRIITQSAEQVRQDKPGAITRLAQKIPGIKQIIEYERPGLKMTDEQLTALVSENAARKDVSARALATRNPLLKDLETAFGKDALHGGKVDVPFVGTTEQAKNPITNTLKDIADNPDLYTLTDAQKAALAKLNTRNTELLDRVVTGYNAEIGEFKPKEGGAFLPNVDIAEDVVEALGGETRAVASGRAKTRIWPTARDRMAYDKSFEPELDVQKLIEGMDTSKTSAASGQTFREAIGGKTRLEVMQETHPKLAEKMLGLRKTVGNIRSMIAELNKETAIAIDNFLKSPFEGEDLTALRDALDITIQPGRYVSKTSPYIGMDASELKTTLADIRGQIKDLKPAWEVANLKPYQFVQEGIYRYFPADEAKIIKEMRQTTDNRLLNFIERWRGQAFSGDTSPFAIQGSVGVLADPIGSLKAGIGGIKKAKATGDWLRPVKIDALAEDIASNTDRWATYASLAGRDLHGTPQEFSAGFLSKIPKFDKFTEGTYVTVTRGSFDLWERTSKTLVQHGATQLEADVAAMKVASEIFPLVSPSRLGQSQARAAVLRALPTSYSFIRQPATMMADATKGFVKLATRQPLTPSEKISMKLMTQMAASVLAVSATSAAISAKQKSEDVGQAVLDAINPDPYNGKFASLILGDVRVPIGGPYRAIFRAIYPQEVKGIPIPVPFAGLVNYARNRITPAARTQIDLIQNKDYYGHILLKGDALEQMLRGLEYEVESAAPLTIGSALEGLRTGKTLKETLTEMGSQFLGTNVMPVKENAEQQLTTLVGNLGKVKYTEEDFKKEQEKINNRVLQYRTDTEKKLAEKQAQAKIGDIYTTNDLVTFLDRGMVDNELSTLREKHSAMIDDYNASSTKEKEDMRLNNKELNAALFFWSDTTTTNNMEQVRDWMQKYDVPASSIKGTIEYKNKQLSEPLTTRETIAIEGQESTEKVVSRLGQSAYTQTDYDQETANLWKKIGKGGYTQREYDRDVARLKENIGEPYKINSLASLIESVAYIPGHKVTPIEKSYLDAKDNWQDYLDAPTDKKDDLRKKDAQLEANLIFWGQVSEFTNPKSEAIVHKMMDKYNVPEKSIPAFAENFVTKKMERDFKISQDVWAGYRAIAKEYMDKPGKLYYQWQYKIDHPEINAYFMSKGNADARETTHYPPQTDEFKKKYAQWKGSISIRKKYPDYDLEGEKYGLWDILTETKIKKNLPQTKNKLPFEK